MFHHASREDRNLQSRMRSVDTPFVPCLHDHHSGECSVFPFLCACPVVREEYVRLWVMQGNESMKKGEDSDDDSRFDVLAIVRRNKTLGAHLLMLAPIHLS